MTDIRTIKKYGNRRLYDLTDKQYINLAGLYRLVLSGSELRVVDQAGRDHTCAVLLQVIARQERRTDPELTEGFLREAIRNIARTSGAMATTFLEQTLKLLDNPEGEARTLERVAPANRMRTAQRLASSSFELWRAVEKRIYELTASVEGTVLSAQESEPTTAPTDIRQTIRQARTRRPQRSTVATERR
jgi:polyhydroxyalkanoate synthesis repressor PhaR